MQVDILNPPPPLPFGEGDDAFQLFIKNVTGPERMACLEAADAGSFSQLEECVERLIKDWSNVSDTQGTAIPFKTKDDKGQETRNLPKFMGAIPFKTQVRIVGGVLAFIGVNVFKAEELVKRLGLEDVVLDPTTKLASGGRTKASGTSQT